MRLPRISTYISVRVAFLKPVFHAVCVRTRERVYMYKRIYIHIYTYMYIYIYLYIHIYIYCVCVCDVCVYGRERWIC
jgi:hypothetical protein